ncbi:MAG: hypothetical protein ACNFW9_01545 [Candidatus Kerfeldbacteria bacterium]|jgi:cyanophycin synthetase
MKPYFYAKFYSQAARKLGLKIKLHNAFLIDIFYKKDKVRFYFAMCSKNNAVAHIITKYKNMTNEFLKKNNVPVFEQKKFNNAKFSEILKYTKSLKFPVVVKPVAGLCGMGITVNIINQSELKKSIITATKIDKNIIIEKYYPGWDYRILIVNDKLLAVTKRFPASIIGDGVNSILKLINKKNKHLPKPVKIDQEVKDMLKSKKLTLKSILPLNKTLYLRFRANAALGGTTENVNIKTVHPDNIKISMKAVKLLNLKLAGLDLMTTDITKSYKKTGAGVTEINDNPATDIHMTATVNPIKDIGEQVLINLLKI